MIRRVPVILTPLWQIRAGFSQGLMMTCRRGGSWLLLMLNRLPWFLNTSTPVPGKRPRVHLWGFENISIGHPQCDSSIPWLVLIFQSFLHPVVTKCLKIRSPVGITDGSNWTVSRSFRQTFCWIVRHRRFQLCVFTFSCSCNLTKELLMDVSLESPQFKTRGRFKVQKNTQI